MDRGLMIPARLGFWASRAATVRAEGGLPPLCANVPMSVAGLFVSTGLVAR